MNPRHLFYIGFMIGAFAVLSGLFISTAFAASADLPIRVKIVRCVTQDERIKACEEQGLCCELIETAGGEK